MAEPLSDDTLTRLRELAEKATPGPWGWRGNDDGLVELRGHGPFGRFDGRIISTLRANPCIVTLDDESVALAYDPCDACRQVVEEVGRTSNIDLFYDHRCSKPENLGTVWLNGEHAIEPANAWAVREQHYRSDVASVNHPDAEFIAVSREALPALLDAVEAQRQEIESLREGDKLLLRADEHIHDSGSWIDEENLLEDLMGYWERTGRAATEEDMSDD